jgi:hypothetical protein
MSAVDQLIWAAFLVGLPAALALRFLLDRRRAVRMRGFAERAGLAYRGTDPALESLGLMELPIFRIGKDRRFLHVMEGEAEGRRLLVFDYRHRVGGWATTLTDDSILADLALGIERNREPTLYNMTVVALGDRKSAETTRRRLPDMPGGHTRLERGGEWVVVYRFDRTVPASQLERFLRRALETAAECERDEASPASP